MWNNLALNPWTDCQRINDDVFGKFHSIPEAFMKNPEAFYHHAIENLSSYSYQMSNVLVPSFPGFSPEDNQKVKYIILSTAKIVIFAFFIVNLFVIVRNKRLSFAPAKADESSLLNELYLPLIAISLPIVIVSVVIFPRYHYLQIQAILVFTILFGYLINTVNSVINLPNYTEKIIKICVFGSITFLLPNLAVSGWFSPYPTSRLEIRTPIKNTILTLREMQLPKDTNILYPGGMFFTSDPYTDAKLIPCSTKKDNFERFLSIYNINVIVWPHVIKTDLRYKSDKFYEKFVRNPRAYSFIPIRIPEIPMIIFAHKDLVNLE